MKYSFFGFGVILFGLLGIFFLVMFQEITTNNESEYYVLKEAMEAAMLESVDIACYKNGDENGYIDSDNDGILDDIDGDGVVTDYETGIEDLDDKVGCGINDLKIIEQKFVENFTRRFAASVSGNVAEYKIDFYDIMESPPKATIVISSKTNEYLMLSDKTDNSIEYDKASFTIVNELSGILELDRGNVIKEIVGGNLGGGSNGGHNGKLPG